MTAMALGVAEQGNVKTIRERTVEDLNDYIGIGSQPQLNPPLQGAVAGEGVATEPSANTKKDD